MSKRKKDRRENAAQAAQAAKNAPTPKSRAHVLKRRKGPNWPLLALSLAGVALAGYLTVTHYTQAGPAYCGEGSDCDLVQNSRWGQVFGLPVAFWGLLLYLALGHVAYRFRNPEWHWKSAWTLSLVGVAVSVYLTVVSIEVLGATCLYCLASLVLLLAILLLVSFQKPEGLPEFRWPAWLGLTGGTALAVLVVLHLNYQGVFSAASGPEDPWLRDLAIHLDSTGAQFYGADWCPNCQTQKDVFGASAGRLPYVECSPSGRSGPTAAQCVTAGINAYPTWIIGGEKYTGVQEPEALARYTNFATRRE